MSLKQETFKIGSLYEIQYLISKSHEKFPINVEEMTRVQTLQTLEREKGIY